MTSVDKFITCLMLANKICFWGKTAKNYKNQETLRKMCPPKVRQLFNLNNLIRLGVVYEVPKTAHLAALEGFGIRVALRLHETSEAKNVYEFYGEQYVPLK
jgi:hypothetical protein